jgi:hypothetical protein
MRSYFIDEISPSHLKKIEAYLNEHALSSDLNEIFWVKLPDGLLTEPQSKHRDCHPYVFAIELGRDWIKAECLIRSLNNMKCEAQAYCDPRQWDFITKYIHGIIKDLGIQT